MDIYFLSDHLSLTKKYKKANTAILGYQIFLLSFPPPFFIAPYFYFILFPFFFFISSSFSFFRFPPSLYSRDSCSADPPRSLYLYHTYLYAGEKTEKPRFTGVGGGRRDAVTWNPFVRIKRNAYLLPSSTFSSPSTPFQPPPHLASSRFYTYPQIPDGATLKNDNDDHDERDERFYSNYIYRGKKRKGGINYLYILFPTPRYHFYNSHSLIPPSYVKR